MKKSTLSTLLLAVFVSSCMVGPKYTRPEIKTPQVWLDQNKYVNSPDSIIHLKWFQIFRDTVLNRLISDAILQNYNLTNAAARIEQSRAAYGITKAEMLPSVGYSAAAGLNSGSVPHDFGMLATASWEIDFWGKLRHSKKAAYAQLLASEEGMKTVTTTLISDVASLYFQLRDLDNRLAISNRAVESRTKYVNLINERFKGGDVAELDLLQANQQLYIAKATVSSLKRQLNYTERSLNILLGQAPQSVPRGLANKDQQGMPVIPAGLPSSLLDQRPDVRQAELQLMTETERIGVAQAMRFPSFSITGFLGFASSDLTTLVTDASFVSNATATILGPIFSFGANKRRVDIQRKEAEIAANNYANVYISALGEVENSLVSIQTYTDEYEERSRVAADAGKSLMLSQQRYLDGYTDYLEVLVAENAMLDSELQASATRAQQLSSYIYLYRALGGGW